MKKTARSRFLLRWFVSSLGLWLAAAILGTDKISFQNKFSVVVVAGLVLALVNTVIKPLVVFLSLPAVLLSLGIFMVVINGITVSIAAWLYKSLQVSSFASAILAGMIIGLTNFLVSALVQDE